ncbi:hypothetical protein MKW94_003257 [Papaver nudicaule]|uniref:Epidermal patterning factor-like protein n=1 Tax=Papaver nudicaule TaxID=74823 RepID=A0AA41SHP2_PAPNU|nr:hypothetical protein [Papaver nudicaule]
MRRNQNCIFLLLVIIFCLLTRTSISTQEMIPPNLHQNNTKLIFHTDFSTVFTSPNGARKLMILGSRPPQCVNKCFSCRPCTAALVISPHNRETKSVRTNLMASSPASLVSKQDDDGTYYLLSWKCRCGNKTYQP